MTRTTHSAVWTVVLVGVLLGQTAICQVAQPQAKKPAPKAVPALKPAKGEKPGTAADGTVRREPGYRGIWFTLGQVSEHGDKYSGGLGTYTAKHVPLAVYAPKADKTFFVYGGCWQEKRYLLAMISYFDHKTHQVPRPVVVHDKGGVNDPHDNPSLCIDEKGTIWVFVSGRGRHRPGYIYRSLKPYDIDGFEQVTMRELTYPQPRWIEGEGFLHLFTKYTRGRELYWSTSTNGKDWAADQKLAGMGGHYQTSFQQGRRVITAFNMHPGGNVDKRTNLYFAQSDDMGRTWRTAGGQELKLPLTAPDCPALVRDYAAEKRLAYMKDINLDAQGRPVILVVTSADYRPGPNGDPRVWTVVHWDGSKWLFHEAARSDHNYDMGSLYVQGDTWRIIGPTEPGPQPWGVGGEMVAHVSRDQGRTWTKERQITRSSPRNHAYARRPVNAHDDFYAFWADGDPRKPSPSHLYFTNRSGDQVWELPYTMEGDLAQPKPLYAEKKD